MIFGWYGLGRLFIEGLRTDSLYIGSTGIRVSQALSIALALISLALLVYNSRKAHKPEGLFVNRQALKDEPQEAVSEETENKASTVYIEFTDTSTTQRIKVRLNKKINIDQNFVKMLDAKEIEYQINQG